MLLGGKEQLNEAQAVSVYEKLHITRHGRKYSDNIGDGSACPLGGNSTYIVHHASSE